MAKRRIMRSFVLKEISVVGNPAQKGATATIMKSASADEREPPMEQDNLTKADEAARDFNKLTAVLRKEHGLSGTDALVAARKLLPQAHAALSGQPASYATVDEALDALTKLEGTAYKIAARDGISKLDALQVARREHPEMYSDLNGCEAPVAKFSKDRASASFDAEVEAVMDNTGCTRLEALAKVRRSSPLLVEAMQKGIPAPPRELAGMPPEKVPGETAKANWFAAIAKIQDSNRGMSYTAAMVAARKAHPDLFKAYQAIGGEQVSGRTV
jgi:hypothetical protein